MPYLVAPCLFHKTAHVALFEAQANLHNNRESFTPSEQIAELV